MFFVKQLLIRLGRRLVLIQYTNPTPAQYTDLAEANKEISRMKIQNHDLSYRVQELTRELASTKIRKIIAEIRHD